MGITCRFLDPSEAPPAAAAGEVIRRPFGDSAALAELADSCDVVTYEFENVPVDSARFLAERLPVHPTPRALDMAQDRIPEKEGFRRLGIGTAPFQAVESLQDLRGAVESLGMPAVLKTRRFGYDGKGQARIKADTDLGQAFAEIGGQPAILEAFVPFEREVSVIAARDVNGTVACFDVAENVHENGILRSSTIPAKLKPRTATQGRHIAATLLDALDYVGVIGVEMFLSVKGGEESLMVNEIAPRVHNSGHWTIEGAETSQFENHLRAITRQPLGSTACRGHAGMLNLIGEIPEAARHLAIPGSRLHDYGKSPREGRKLGHITVVADTAAKRDARLRQLEDALAKV